MNREQLRLSKKIGQAKMHLPFDEFKEMSALNIMRIRMPRHPERAWTNNNYSVQLYKRDRIFFGIYFDKIMIRRHDAKPIAEWHTVQKIKNMICGDDVEAFQVFPRQDDLVDVANMYWLFVESGRL